MANNNNPPILPSIGALTLLPVIVHSRAGVSRSGLAGLTGLSRVTISQRLSELFEASIISEGEDETPTGGRPRRQIRLNKSAAVIAAADVGETHLHIAITDLEPIVLAEVSVPFELRQPPEETLTTIVSLVTDLIKELERDIQDVVGLGLSLRAPVNFDEGTIVGPSVMEGWDDFDIPNFLGQLIPVPILIDNDVNLLAMSEANQDLENSAQIAFVKVGTGIGCGIIADRGVVRGAHGVSGDIGHIQLVTEGAKLCRCGKLGCVEAHAAGWAIARDLRELGYDTHTAEDVLEVLRANVPEAIQLMRQAGRVIGEVVANLVSILNPDKVIIGGVLAETSDHVLSGVKEIVYQRCLPLATRHLIISTVKHRPEAGVIGAALLVRDWAFEPGNTKSTVHLLFERLHPRARSNRRNVTPDQKSAV
ncbi:MAG: ROK family protein [Paracoccaceae bacterium]